jgi:hypothetical protein
MPENTVQCPRCGKPAQGRFCGECGAPLAKATCPSCRTTLSAGARFCHVCGAPLGAGRRPAAAAARAAGVARIAPWLAAGAVVVIAIIVAVRMTGGSAAAPAGGAPGPAAAVDITQMTPRERADRLFDRIVRAAEAGDTAQVLQFQPMALSAYGMLGGLDSDARYHVGLIHALAGNLDAAQAQVDSLRMAVPNHLLATMLDYTVARLAGDSDGQRAAYRAFLDAYDAEMASPREEYVAHEQAIRAFRAAAQEELGAND